MLQYEKHKDKQINATLLRSCGNMIGAACRLPGETLKEGVAMRQEFVVNVDYYLLNFTIHIYSPET
jgi:hypothetical protein